LIVGTGDLWKKKERRQRNFFHVEVHEAEGKNFLKKNKWPERQAEWIGSTSVGKIGSKTSERPVIGGGDETLLRSSGTGVLSGKKEEHYLVGE